jgi:hypothetical protein
VRLESDSKKAFGRASPFGHREVDASDLTLIPFRFAETRPEFVSASQRKQDNDSLEELRLTGDR